MKQFVGCNCPIFVFECRLDVQFLVTLNLDILQGIVTTKPLFFVQGVPLAWSEILRHVGDEDDLIHCLNSITFTSPSVTLYPLLQNALPNCYSL